MTFSTCFDTYDFEVIDISFSGIAEGADLNTYIMKIKVGTNNYKMNVQNTISSYVVLHVISLDISGLVDLFRPMNDMVFEKKPFKL